MSDIILQLTGGNESLVSYEEEEKFTTLHKKVSCEKAIKDLKHNPKIVLKDGLDKTVKWMKSVYIDNNSKKNILEFL